MERSDFVVAIASLNELTSCVLPDFNLSRFIIHHHEIYLCSHPRVRCWCAGPVLSQYLSTTLWQYHTPNVSTFPLFNCYKLLD